MLSSSLKRFLLTTAVAAAALASLPAQAAYGGLVIFGDSLSDSGNNFIAISAAPPPGTPIPPITPNAAIANNSFIPALPFQGAPIPVYSNGPVWATSFATALGLSATPSLLGGTNFAFGGAVTGGTSGFPFSLTDQVAQFLGATGGVAPANYLYVVAGGGNDARGALASIAANPGNAAAITGAAAFNFANNVSNIVDELQVAGAKNIVVWNMPDVGRAPAVRAQGAGAAALATNVSATMSGALAAALAGEVGVTTFDLSGTFAAVFDNPGAYGLSNVTDACIMGACPANEYIFWDGIHPTARGHQILAQAMYAQVVPEPETYLLFAVGLAALAWRSRQRAS